MRRSLAYLLSLAAIPFVAAAQSPHPSAMSVRTELDNPAVTVIRIRMAPHAKTPEHDVTPRVVVWLTDAHLRLSFPDGTTRTEDHKAGDVAWVSALRHVGENLSDQPLEFLAVIPKR
jgi:quercetin dioxygenase-like cupin family protein